MSSTATQQSSARDIAGDVAFVTGAASGIGLALTRELAKLGAKVIMVDINEDACKTTAEELNQQADGNVVAVAVKADTRSWEEQLAAYEIGVKAFGRVDYFFANAGISERSWIPPPSESDTTPDTKPITKPDLTTLEIQLTGNLYTSALALQVFERQEPNRHGFRGKLVLTASIYSYWVCASMPMYNAGKTGILQFMRSTARLCEKQYGAGKGVTVNSVAPNLVATGIAGSSELFEPFKARGLLTSVEFVVQQYISVLGDSKDNGRAISINKEQIWDHPIEMTNWEDNKECLDLLEHVGGAGLGLWQM
ncbi:hypothetical protein PM082_014127 [Marasmius tenuissimus]|nr:hypothetical protein PM082_014127 [Marasmius tenuissimus]